MKAKGKTVFFLFAFVLNAAVSVSGEASANPITTCEQCKDMAPDPAYVWEDTGAQRYPDWCESATGLGECDIYSSTDCQHLKQDWDTCVNFPPPSDTGSPSPSPSPPPSWAPTPSPDTGDGDVHCEAMTYTCLTGKSTNTDNAARHFEVCKSLADPVSYTHLTLPT